MSLRIKSRTVKKRNSLILLFVSLFFSCAFAQAAQEVIAQKETGEEVLDVAKTTEDQKPESESKDDDYFYDPRGKTDPFKSFIAIAEEMEEKRKRKPRTYLETVELSQLQLTMIITGGKESWAMVRDSKGLGHVIKKGTFLGTDGGFVHEITEKKVIIHEEYKDFRGNLKFRERIKELPSLM